MKGLPPRTPKIHQVAMRRSPKLIDNPRCARQQCASPLNRLADQNPTRTKTRRGHLPDSEALAYLGIFGRSCEPPKPKPSKVKLFVTKA
jgi:hypothetical protein